MRYVLWLLSGAVLAPPIVLGFALLGLARLNPWLARRLARSAAASALLGFLVEMGLLVCADRREQ